MINIKMIVTDFDRTLLRTDKTISGYTANVLKRCRESGIKVVFATARPKRTVNDFLIHIPADAIIVHNGAVVYTKGSLLHRCGIASETKNKILLSICKDYPEARMSVEIEDTLYANFDVSNVWNNTQAVRSDFTDLPDKPADKIIIGVSSSTETARYAKYLPDDLYIESSEGRLALIMHKGATKWKAVELLSERFRINISDIAAFGDDYNDIEMLHNCGVGVAVANALDEAKAAAGYICKSNDRDGVARWIEENIRYVK